MNDQEYQKYVTGRAKKLGIKVKFSHDNEGTGRVHYTLEEKTGDRIHKGSTTHSVPEALARYASKKG